MNICILGGDKRQLQIIKELKDKHNLSLVGYENMHFDKPIKQLSIYEIDLSTFEVVIFPISGVDNDGYISTIFGEKFSVDEKLLINTKKTVQIFTGIITRNLQHMLDVSNRIAIPLMNDPEVIQENTIPTVEGIIADIIYNTEITIKNSNIFLIGYGNIGKKLLPLLIYLGANTVLGVLQKADITTYKSIETSCLDDMKKVITCSDIIINTAPTLILNEELLDCAKTDTYILDVASYPYGVDFNYANKRGLKNKLLSGIPSKVAPVTSGLILSKRIKSRIGSEKDD